jgi:hypothetical protein
MMMLGSYSYLNDNEKRFSYTTTATTTATTIPAEQCETHHFAIQPVNKDIAMLRFFTDGHFAKAKPVPPKFMLTGGLSGGARHTFKGCFFPNWTCSYKLCHTRSPMLRMSHQKQKLLTCQNRASIHSCS